MKEKVQTLAFRIIRSELISGSFFLFLGTTIGNILAFAFNFILVRHLTFAQYAEFTALINLVALAGIPASAFLPTIVQFAGKYFARNENAHAAELFWQSSWKIGSIALVFFLGFFIFSPLLGDFLHIHESVKFLLVGAVVASIYLSITNTAFLQSLLKFRFLAMTIIIGGILKLLVGLVAVQEGFGMYGILFGYFLTFFIPLLLTYMPLRFLLIRKITPTIHNKEIFAYGLPATLAIFSLSSFTSTDILLVKHFFSSSQAALYSGLSLTGRIIFYFTAPISSVMFPLVIKRMHKGENATNLLLASFLLVLIPSCIIAFSYFLFPRLIVSIVLGSKYFVVAPLLGWFGLYIGIFSLLNVAVNFLLSIKKTTVSSFVATGAVLQILGISLFHATLSEVVWVSLILVLVLFVLLLLYYQKSYATPAKP